MLDLRLVQALASRFAARDTALSLSRSELLAGRVLEVTEEVGEAAQAYIGTTGRNPRKGVTNSAASPARPRWSSERDRTLLRSARTLASGVPGAHLAVVAGGDHSPQVSRPQAWLRAVERHLDRVDGGPG